MSCPKCGYCPSCGRSNEDYQKTPPVKMPMGLPPLQPQSHGEPDYKRLLDKRQQTVTYADPVR